MDWEAPLNQNRRLDGAAGLRSQRRGAEGSVPIDLRSIESILCVVGSSRLLEGGPV